MEKFCAALMMGAIICGGSYVVWSFLHRQPDSWEVCGRGVCIQFNIGESKDLSPYVKVETGNAGAWVDGSGNLLFRTYYANGPKGLGFIDGKTSQKYFMTDEEFIKAFPENSQSVAPFYFIMPTVDEMKERVFNKK